MEKVLVADVMTRNPITVPSEINLLQCAKIMVKKKTGSLLIVEGNRLVGIISRKDILWALVKQSRKELKNILAVDISPRKIATIKPTESLEQAMKKIKKVKFARLPVIYHGELVGLITAKDIFNFNPNLFPEMREYNQIREWEHKVKRIQRAKERTFSEGEGICEECGNQDFLFYFNGMLICESCKNS